MLPGQWSSLWQTSLVFATVRHPLTRAVRSWQHGVKRTAAAVTALGTPPIDWETFCHDPMVGEERQCGEQCGEPRGEQCGEQRGEQCGVGVCIPFAAYPLLHHHRSWHAHALRVYERTV